MKKINRKYILLCGLFLIARISVFSQTDTVSKKATAITADTLQKKIPAYLPSAYGIMWMPYDSIRVRQVFFGSTPYTQKINLYNTYLPCKKWSGAFTAAGQVFLSAFGENNNHAYIFPKK